MYTNFDELPISLSVVQAAEVLGVSDVSLYHLIKTDKTFPVVNIGRRMTIPKDELREWIKNNCYRK